MSGLSWKRFRSRAALALVLAGGMAAGVVGTPAAEAGVKITWTCTTNEVRVGYGATTLFKYPLEKCVPTAKCDAEGCVDIPSADPKALLGGTP
jgi:hypothetical protein